MKETIQRAWGSPMAMEIPQMFGDLCRAHARIIILESPLSRQHCFFLGRRKTHQIMPFVWVTTCICKWLMVTFHFFVGLNCNLDQALKEAV